MYILIILKIAVKQTTILSINLDLGNKHFQILNLTYASPEITGLKLDWL